MLWEDEIIDVAGAGYDPVGDFTVGGRRLTPQGHPGLVRMLEAACLCNNAVLANGTGEEEATTLGQVLTNSISEQGLCAVPETAVLV